MFLGKVSSFYRNVHWDLRVEQRWYTVQWGFTREERKDGGEGQGLRPDSWCGGDAF